MTTERILKTPSCGKTTSPVVSRSRRSGGIINDIARAFNCSTKSVYNAFKKHDEKEIVQTLLYIGRRDLANRLLAAYKTKRTKSKSDIKGMLEVGNLEALIAAAQEGTRI